MSEYRFERGADVRVKSTSVVGTVEARSTYLISYAKVNGPMYVVDMDGALGLFREDDLEPAEAE